MVYVFSYCVLFYSLEGLCNSVFLYNWFFSNYKETTTILEIIVNLSIIPMTLSVVFITISVARDRQELLIFGLKETECPLSLFSFGFLFIHNYIKKIILPIFMKTEKYKDK